MTHVLIICFSKLHKDPRVLRQIRALSGYCTITAAGFTDPAIEGCGFVALDTPDGRLTAQLQQASFMMLRCFDSFYWSQAHIRTALTRLQEVADTCNVIIANDIEALPLALTLAKPKSLRVVYDAHEYTPCEFDDRWKWRFFLKNYKTWLCSTFMPRADLCITVNTPIADTYAKQLGVKCEVNTNAAEYYDFLPRATHSGRIRLIHHGIATPERKIAPMIEMAKLLDERFEITFVLVAGDNAYIQEMKQAASGHPRIHFVEPVANADIVPMLHNYDVGFYLLEPSNLNFNYALPNKFFEFIQARLVLVISPNLAMAQIVQQYGCGIVSADFSPQRMAAAINTLDVSAIDACKQASHNAAQELHAGHSAKQWRDWVGV